jgi:hypothetical protein
MTVMPDLCSPSRGFRHDVDSAVAALRRAGVEADRIVLRSAGPGWAQGTVMAQAPEPGAPISPRTLVVLSVAGAGGLDLLPYPLRDAADDGFGVDGLMALFDSPLGKLALHVRQAGGFLALHPDDEPVILRWIEEIFQLSAEPFPRESWYALARLLPALHRVAGTAEAVRLGVELVCGLPVASVRTVRGIVPLAPEGRTRLGRAASRLGVDTVAGEGVEAPCALEVTLGPLTLAQWREHHGDARSAQRQALYRLLVPAPFHRAVREAWAVGDPAAGARPGDPRSEPVLGINARLGAIPERSAA